MKTRSVHLNPLSRHAQLRSSHRNLSNDDISLVLKFGQKVYRIGACFYFLGRRNLPESLRANNHYAKLVGTVLIVSQEGTIITLYRDPTALKKIRKKPKHRTRSTKHIHIEFRIDNAA
jgi:hypothetical protein